MAHILRHAWRASRSRNTNCSMDLPFSNVAVFWRLSRFVRQFPSHATARTHFACSSKGMDEITSLKAPRNSRNAKDSKTPLSRFLSWSGLSFPFTNHDAHFNLPVFLVCNNFTKPFFSEISPPSDLKILRRLVPVESVLHAD